jgi:hypothetical protein
MSQLILDDQLDVEVVLPPLRKWITVECLHELRSGEHILDDRIPEIFRTLKQPTFVTIDQDFWHPLWCHPAYCILYFALRDDQQELLPGLLRALLRRPEFRTRAVRMGKVARVSTFVIDYWQHPPGDVQHASWPVGRRKR